MRKTVINPQRMLIGLVLALLVSSLLPASWARLLSQTPRHLLAATLMPTDHLIKPLADKLRRPADLSVDLGNQEEYEHANQQIMELQYKLRQAHERIAQLSEIRDTLRLVGVKLLSATITSWSADRHHPAVILNRGRRHGLDTGLIVTRGFSLVGRVTDASSVTSTVGLITAPDTHLIVKVIPPIAGSAPRELITQIRSVKGKDVFWADTDADDPVQIGDLAHLVDDTWPSESRGLVVGKVTQILKHPDDPILRRRLVVTPIRSLAHLSHVTVIIPATSTSPTVWPGQEN